MEYGELGHLRQLLEEDFIEFLCRTYKSTELYLQAIQVNVADVLEMLKAPASTSQSPIPRKLSLFFSGLKFISVSEKTRADGIRSGLVIRHYRYKTALYDRNIFYRGLSIVHKFDEVLASLESYVDQDPSSSGHSFAFFEQYSRREFADYLLSSIKKHREFVCLLNSLAEVAIAFHDSLRSLLLQLKDSNDIPEAYWLGYCLVHIGVKLDNFLSNRDRWSQEVDVECLETAKRIIDACRSIVYRCQSKTDHSLTQGDHNFNATVEGMGLLHRLQHLFCLHARNEEDGDHGTNLGNSPSSSWFKNQQLPMVQKDCLEVPQFIFGLDLDITEIVDQLTLPPSKLSLVTVAGMGGIGKTTLARKVYSNTRVVDHFRFTAWISGISITSTNEALSHLLHSIPMISADVVQRAKSDFDKGQIVWRSLKEKRYLIVLDDLWNFEVWKAIEQYFPDDKVGSRIFITSRSMGFPSSIPMNPAHCMRLLNGHESWEMLQRLVFGDRCCPSELVATGEMISRKCGGLRITIVVIAGILNSIPSSCESWRCVMDGVQSIVSDNPELDILALSFKYLPHHLKSCFNYMGNFPANYEFDAEKLFNLWLAEGFLYSKASNPPEIEARQYLEDLIHRCLVMVGERSFDGKIKTCSIHELLRQLCIRENEYSTQVVRRTGRDQRHLIISEINENILPVLGSYHCLRSFTVLSGSAGIGNSLVTGGFANKLRRLRVLDLYCLSFETLPQDVKRLLNLRYLAINVAHVLDNSFSAFWKLQTLVIYGPWETSTRYLPIFFLDFWRMPLLRSVTVRAPSHLKFYKAPEQLPDFIPIPSNLHTLQTVTFSCCNMETFHLLSKLKKLGVCENKNDLENDAYKTCFQTLLSLTELETLKCFFSKFRLNGNSKFRLNGNFVHPLPSNLKKLTLCGGCLSWDNMKLLASLPKLETLKLKDHAFKGEKWMLTDVVFGCLKQMLIEESDLELWEAEGDDHFPCLEHLVLRSCGCLLSVPFEALSALQLIDLYKCNGSVVASAKEYKEQYGCPVVTETKKKKVVEKSGKSIVYEQ